MHLCLPSTADWTKTRAFLQEYEAFLSGEGLYMRPSLGNRELDQCVTTYVLHVGHVYGRRTMQGLLRGNGIVVSQARIAASLRRVAPIQYCARSRFTYRMLNPSPYRASHYMAKNFTSIKTRRS